MAKSSWVDSVQQHVEGYFLTQFEDQILFLLDSIIDKKDQIYQEFLLLSSSLDSRKKDLQNQIEALGSNPDNLDITSKVQPDGTIKNVKVLNDKGKAKKARINGQLEVLNLEIHPLILQMNLLNNQIESLEQELQAFDRYYHIPSSLYEQLNEAKERFPISN